MLIALAIAAGAVGAGAQTDEIEQARAEREAKAAEIAEAAARLDPLLAEDAELEAAVASLELHVAAKQARLEATRQALSAARDEADEAAEKVVEAVLAIDELRSALRSRVVEAYVSPDSERVDSALTADDLTSAALKRALLETISGSEIDLLDRLRAAEAHLEDLESQAAEAVVEVAQQEAAEASGLSELEVALADLRRLREALQERIAHLHAEIEALEAQEDTLTSLITGLIAEEEARQRAVEEARRRAEEAARRAAEAPDSEPIAPLPAPPSASGLVWPTQGVVSSWFGPRWGRQHQGIDIAGPTGSPVVAAQAGTVLSAGTLSGYGRIVVVDHGEGFVTVYAHLSDISVGAGQGVGRGQQIGAMGCTGSCTGPHLHFETRVLGVPQDPMLYL